MKVMSARKPIIITQSATTAYSANGLKDEANIQWLCDIYADPAKRKPVKTYRYFNFP